MALSIYHNSHKMKDVLEPVTDLAVTETLEILRRKQMKEKQHNPNMTYRISILQHYLMSLRAKGRHKQSQIDVMLFSMISGLRIEEVTNLRYRHLAFETDQETGNRKHFHFRFPESNGNKDGE